MASGVSIFSCSRSGVTLLLAGANGLGSGLLIPEPRLAGSSNPGAFFSGTG